MNDMIYHPKHYTQASVLLEPIDILRYAPFDLGNAIKYVIRAGHKDDKKQDLQKALKYINWAMDNYYMNSKPYVEFFTYYGKLLSKFDLFRSDRDFIVIQSHAFMSDLREDIEWRLKNEV